MPSWVSVPVPEEHVQEVMEFVIRTIARASIEEWDEASVETLFAKVDEASRSLLSVVARAATTGKELTEQQAADFIELTVRETFGIIREVNDAARTEGRPALVGTTTVAEVLPNGRTRDKRIVTMNAVVAKMVRNAERVIDGGAPHPLQG
jgi:hypothetical protein